AAAFARVRPWFSRELLYLLAGATVASAVAAFVLPALAAVACGLVAFAALVVAFFARRLMFEERTRRRAAQAAELRERERALRAEDALDVVALGLAGDPDSRSALLRHKVLWQAIRSLEERVARTYEEHRRLYLTTPPRPDQPIAPPDVGALRRRRVERHAQLAAVADEIRAVEPPRAA
ncbi:MAG: hypothetical protein M3P50_11385, partial [Actinomycetota bacterium]|nr:hypothetical protein [Actinomycetota bacterium]